MIYDISMNVNEAVQVYKNADDKKPSFEAQYTHADKPVHETKLHINMHTGTHVDYPLHMIDGGKTSDDYDLSPFIGTAKLFDMTHVQDGITKADIEHLAIEEGDIVLFKTTNSFEDTFNYEFVYVKEDAARYLKGKRIKSVGIDGLGIERSQAGHPTHKILLSNDILIIEGLRFRDVPEGTYTLYCLPLKLDHVEAALARAILVK